jgi:hypothetical protein
MTIELPESSPSLLATPEGLNRSLEVERAMGIEPTAQAWEAWVLPLYDARAGQIITRSHRRAN